MLLRLTICIIVMSHFRFEGGTLFLIASVPGHCLPFACLRALISWTEVSHLIVTLPWPTISPSEMTIALI